MMLVLIKLIACSTHPYYLWITTKERERAKLKYIYENVQDPTNIKTLAAFWVQRCLKYDNQYHI